MTRDGECPECGSTETLRNGKVPPHCTLVMTARGIERTRTPCPGGSRVVSATCGSPACDRTFEPKHPNQVYCCQTCYERERQTRRRSGVSRSGYLARRALVRRMWRTGDDDAAIAAALGITKDGVRALRRRMGIGPANLPRFTKDRRPMGAAA